MDLQTHDGFQRIVSLISGYTRRGIFFHFVWILSNLLRSRKPKLQAFPHKNSRSFWSNSHRIWACFELCLCVFRCLTLPLLSDNTAGIVTKRVGFRRRLQEIYFLPVVIEDNGYPPKSSTGTLTIRVCGCQSDGSVLSCSAEAIFLPVGLSTGALIAILLCIVILLGEIFLQKRKRTSKTMTQTSTVYSDSCL